MYEVGGVELPPPSPRRPNSDETTDPTYQDRAGFDPAGLAKFDRMVAARQLHVVYRKDGVTIYGVGA